MPIEVIRMFEDEIQYRPRISYKVSEYVLGYINQTVLEPMNILQSLKYTYQFTLGLEMHEPKQKFFSNSPYNNSVTNYITTSFRTHDKVTKWTLLMITSKLINSKMKPDAYAGIVYDAFADFLIRNFKSLSKEKFDTLKTGMDYSIINSFPYPAPFEEQQYMLDDSPCIPTGKINDPSSWTTKRDEYMKHFDF